MVSLSKTPDFTLLTAKNFNDLSDKDMQWVCYVALYKCLLDDYPEGS